MPPRTRQATAAETAVDQTPVESPEAQVPPVETPEDGTAPNETATDDKPGRKAKPAADPVYVQALLREREGYMRYGRKYRAAGVDTELKRIGEKPPRD